MNFYLRLDLVLSPIRTRFSAGTPVITAGGLTVLSGGRIAPNTKGGGWTATPGSPTACPTSGSMAAPSGLIVPPNSLIARATKAGGQITPPGGLITHVAVADSLTPPAPPVAPLLHPAV
jgi:hypothetical protein